MNQKVTITLQFSSHQITYHGSDHEGSYQLPENSYFETHTLTFNEMGHIKGAKTLTYHAPSKNYHFVFSNWKRGFLCSINSGSTLIESLLLLKFL